MQNYEEMMQEVDKQVSAIDLNGKNIIGECKTIIVFLKEKLGNLKARIQAVPFGSEMEEVTFFKYQKPMLMGQLIYFYKILRIESQRPVCAEMLDAYYEKLQEEQKMFFDRHVAFFQYYRSGATYLDKYYFLRGRQEAGVEVDVCPFDDDAEFSTGYDHLVARIIAMEMLYAYLTARRRALQQPNDEPVPLLLKEYRWTGKMVYLVELLYALDTNKCINHGKIEIDDLASYLGLVFNIDLKNCYNTYVDMKKRKEDSRTYFLDELSKDLNQRMDQDDERKRSKR